MHKLCLDCLLVLLLERFFPTNTGSWIFFPHYSFNLCSAATMAFGNAQYSFQSTAPNIYEPINWCCLFEAAQSVGRTSCWF